MRVKHDSSACESVFTGNRVVPRLLFRPFSGEAVEAYYFSTSAGVTSTDEIWGSDEAAPYLRSVPCKFDEEEPWSSWIVELPWKMLEDRIREKGEGTVLLSLIHI